MTNAQTEARAIALKVAGGVINNDEASYVVRRVTKLVAAALAAKDAELAMVRDNLGALLIERSEIIKQQIERAERAEAQRDKARKLAEQQACEISNLRSVIDLIESEKASAIQRAEAQLAEANKALEQAQKKLRGCQWYWPEDDTSSECCADSAQEVVQNAYDWQTASGEVVAVARGGIVSVTYCAALPPADDADSDDDFCVEEATEEAARAKIEAEIARRAREAHGGENG